MYTPLFSDDNCGLDIERFLITTMGLGISKWP